MVDKPLPQSHEAERALLGGLIRDPDEIDGVRSRVSPSDFHRPDHQNLYALLLQMRDERTPVEDASLAERVLRGGQEDAFGGLDYVLRLPSEAPATANLGHYAETIRRKALSRRFVGALRELTEEAYAEGDDPFRLVDRGASKLMALVEGEQSRDWQQVSTVIDEELARINEVFRARQDLTGLPTGFKGLDDKLAGLHPETLVVLAARPGMGKTALALNIARSVAQSGRSVGIFSLEMGRQELVNRLLSDLATVDGKRLRSGNLSDEDWERLGEGAENLRELRIFFDDTPGLTGADLRARARRLKALHDDLGLIVIDYLQLMQGDDPKAPRQQQVADISRGLKILSKELKIPVLALSQLNREIDKRKEDDRRPRLSDLRESGAIEQDADVILFIFRRAAYMKDPDPITAREAEVIVAKQRAGETGDVKMVFLGAFARFGDRADDFGGDL